MFSDPDPGRLMVLSLNGGGVKGYSSLGLLEEIGRVMKSLDEIGQENQHAEDFRPGRYFDVICGTSTGAIIAIMLGRFDRSVGQCKADYESFSRKIFGASGVEVAKNVVSTATWKHNPCVFPYRYCPRRLENAIDEWLQPLGPDTPLIPETGYPSMGRVLIPVIKDGNPHLLRTYGRSDIGPVNGWTVKAAIMAATAALYIFPPFLYEGIRYYDAAPFKLNNPSTLLRDEITRQYPHHKEQLVLDIGTGTHNHKLVLSCWTKLLKSMIRLMTSELTETRTVAQMVYALYNTPDIDEDIYFRLDVVYPTNTQSIKAHHYRKLELIKKLTEEHIKEPEVRKNIENIARRMADVHSGRYFQRGIPLLNRDRYNESCNRIFDTKEPVVGVCCLNKRDLKFIGSSEPDKLIQYTSKNLPDALLDFKIASDIIANEFDAPVKDISSLNRAIFYLLKVRKVQKQAVLTAKGLAALQSIFNEFTLTVAKQRIASWLSSNIQDSDKQREGIEFLVDLADEYKIEYPEFVSPCEWLSSLRPEC